MKLPVVLVPAKELQRMFNDAGLDTAVQDGLCREVIDRKQTKHVTRDLPVYGDHIPVGRCSMSEISRYFDLSEPPQRIALVHQYRLKTGQLEASGKPDPKALFLNGTKYMPELPPDADGE